MCDVNAYACLFKARGTGVWRLLDAEFFQLVAQGSERDAQQLSGRGLVAIRLGQGLLDRSSLYLLQILLQRRLAHEIGLCQVCAYRCFRAKLQILGRDFTAVTKS